MSSTSGGRGAPLHHTKKKDTINKCDLQIILKCQNGRQTDWRGEIAHWKWCWVQDRPLVTSCH